MMSGFTIFSSPDGGLMMRRYNPVIITLFFRSCSRKQSLTVSKLHENLSGRKKIGKILAILLKLNPGKQSYVHTKAKLLLGRFGLSRLRCDISVLVLFT